MHFFFIENALISLNTFYTITTLFCEYYFCIFSYYFYYILNFSKNCTIIYMTLSLLRGGFLYYDKELEFFRNILKNFRIDTCIIPFGDKSFRRADKGFRDFLGLSDEYNRLFCVHHESLNERTIYKITDSFYCNYIFILFPDADATFVAGPYIGAELTQKMITQAAERYSLPPEINSQIEKYYTSIPVYTNKDIILSLFNSLGEILWGKIESFRIENMNMTVPENRFPEIVSSLEKRTDDAMLAMQMLEARYDGENRLLQAVSQGLTHKAEQIIGNSTDRVLEMRVDDPIRNMKNYTVIMNTLLRKAVEQGGVHPIYIDSVSTDFAKKIEQITTLSEGISLHHEMVDKYCNLVNRRSMKNYSPLVQRVITIIDSDLTADLSLRKQAQLLNVNASYLSALFKKETGLTLTEYVSKKRVEQAAFLLRSTGQQIQTVAQNCGIYDVNYFTKIFKKITGKTPKEYRDGNR